jgi:acyl-[acyl-carrier-protein]-phospholipid O-acyltransferase/long-chain-fatty-acid--[acyl-carrier-protein] ligase
MTPMTWKHPARRVLRWFVTFVVRLIYRIRPLHPENVPKEGGVLLVSNHVTYVDAFMISIACPRPVRFVIVDHFLKVKFFAWFLRLYDCVPISPTRAKEAIRTAADAVREGSVVCIFPEGQLTRTGMLTELKKGFELIARHAECPVLPVYMDSLWGSIFSFERFRYFRKKPKRFPYPVTVHFGPVIPTGRVAGDTVRSAILDLSVDAFAARDELRLTLGQALIRSLRKGRPAELLVDLGNQRRAFSPRQVAGSAVALARAWQRAWPSGEPARVGVLLPPGAMSGLVHAAVVLAGRVPVTLPLRLLTLPEPERRALLERHGIGRIVSSRVLFTETPFPEPGTDFRETVGGIGAGAQAVSRVAVAALPAGAWDGVLGLAGPDPDDPAVGYLTESLELVLRTHRQVIAEVEQIDSSLIVLPDDRVLVQSNFTTPAAQVFGLWHPLLKRAAVLYRTLAARSVDLGAILADQEPRLVLVDAEMHPELGRLAAGAGSGPVRVWLDFGPEPLAAEVAARLDGESSDYCVGYAPEGLGTILAMNTSDPNSMIPEHLPQIGNRVGSLGRLLPGFAARLIRDGQEVSLFETGELQVSGVSLPSGWHAAGIRGTFDREGFFTVAPERGAETWGGVPVVPRES